jgi:two-component system sensor histidine kinase KdpD
VRAYLLAAAAAAIATLIGLAADAHLSEADHAMLFMLAILAGAFGGRGPGLATAALSVAAFDFFFVAPRFTFAVSDLHSLVTFTVMFLSGAAIGDVVARLRRARDAELRARTEELRATLLSAVSHDLRTPLAAITGMATSLRDEATGAQRESLETIVEEAERLSRILTNLLAITKVESGAAPRREWVPVEELVGTALARLEGELASHAVAVDVPPTALAHVDPILFEQLLINLLDNAAKHTPAGTAIAVSAAREPTGAVLEVADRGPGLPPGPPRQVFEKFFRGEGAHRGGVGLGLAVCRGIAAAHHGTIEALARDGGGAAFRVHFPDDGVPPGLVEAA